MNPLYIFKPDKKSSELTSVPSMFHVGIFKDFTVYIEVFEEETVTNVYKNGVHEIALAYGGTTKKCLQEIHNTINHDNN